MAGLKRRADEALDGDPREPKRPRLVNARVYLAYRSAVEAFGDGNFDLDGSADEDVKAARNLLGRYEVLQSALTPLMPHLTPAITNELVRTDDYGSTILHLLAITAPDEEYVAESTTFLQLVTKISDIGSAIVRSLYTALGADGFRSLADVEDDAYSLALHAASRQGATTLVRLLIEFGTTDRNMLITPGISATSPLKYAIRLKRPKMARYIIDYVLGSGDPDDASDAIDAVMELLLTRQRRLAEDGSDKTRFQETENAVIRALCSRIGDPVSPSFDYFWAPHRAIQCLLGNLTAIQLEGEKVADSDLPWTCASKARLSEEIKALQRAIGPAETIQCTTDPLTDAEDPVSKQLTLFDRWIDAIANFGNINLRVRNRGWSDGACLYRQFRKAASSDIRQSLHDLIPVPQLAIIVDSYYC